MPRDLRIDAVILAAGLSSRLGRSKQLLPLAGKPILQHIVDAANRSDFGEIVVVTGAGADIIESAIALPAHGRFVHNPHYGTGQASSLAAGIRALSSATGAAAVLLGDQPGVADEVIDRVIAAFLASDAYAARPVYGRTPGHPVIMARALWPEVLALTGDTGALAVLSNHAGRLLEIPIDGAPPPDIDTEEDYERLKQEYEDR